MREQFDRTDIAITMACATIAVASILTSLIGAPTVIRAPAVFAGVLFGPAVLLWRLVTRRGWVECFTLGVPVDIAIVMLLGYALVGAHFWYPTAFEQLVPATTLFIGWRILRRGARGAEQEEART
jgi:hypothetical protein